MAGTSTELFAIERELAAGAGDTYRRHLAPDAIMVVPGATLDRDATVEAMDASPGWDEFSSTRRAFDAWGTGLRCSATDSAEAATAPSTRRS